MKKIIDMTNGAVVGLVLKDSPEEPPKMDSCPSCALAKAQRLPFKTCRQHTKQRTLEPLDLVHGDLLGPCLPDQSLVANAVS